MERDRRVPAGAAPGRQEHVPGGRIREEAARSPCLLARPLHRPVQDERPARTAQ
jgi:hypothetical protein